MSGIRRVVAATDFSPDAAHACERAAMVAASHGAALDLGEGVVALLHHAQPGDGQLELDFDLGLQRAQG